MRFNRIYSLGVGLCFLILYSIWASFQFALSYPGAGKIQSAKAWTSSSDLTPFFTAEEVYAIRRSGMDYLRRENNEVDAVTNYWPSWKNETIQIRPMVEFINQLLLDSNNTYTETRERDSKQRYMFAETPYVVNSTGVYSSKTLRKKNVGGQTKHRLLPVEGLINEAIQLLISSRKKEREKRWAQLDELLIQKGYSFPFLAFFGDHNSCNYHNYRDKNNVSQSLPLFTFGVEGNTLDCWNGFPMPSYKMIRDSKRTSKDWDAAFRDRDYRFPWHTKIPKVAWRGSLSDVNAAINSETPRSKLVALANEAFNKTHLFDVGFTSTNHFDLFDFSSPDHLMKDSIRPFEELQQFMAIIDIDGNAWSSRFPTQLCLNSVSLKVEPRYSDYFVESQVKPGVHYIPIKADLSDLLEKTLWVMLHPKESRQIVANARKWCREHMVWKSLARDMLDIWEKYVKWLNEHDPSWYETWKKKWKIWGRQSSAFRPLEITQELSGESLSGEFPSS
jgi:hypothetical protein